MEALKTAAAVALALGLFAGVGLELAELPQPVTAHQLHCPPPGSAWACSP